MNADEAARIIKETFKGLKYPNQIKGYSYAYEVIIAAYFKWSAGEYESFTAALNAEVRKLRGEVCEPK